MSHFADSNYANRIPEPTEERLWELHDIIESAIVTDPFVDPSIMANKGYRVITPRERYYYEELMKIGNTSNTILYGLWVLADYAMKDNYFDGLQRQSDYDAQRQRANRNHHKSNNDDRSKNADNSNMYLVKKRAFENDSSSNDCEIPTVIENDCKSEVDSNADTVTRLNRHNHFKLL